jgi:hypothetical protein
MGEQITVPCTYVQIELNVPYSGPQRTITVPSIFASLLLPDGRISLTVPHAFRWNETEVKEVPTEDGLSLQVSLTCPHAGHGRP